MLVKAAGKRKALCVVCDRDIVQPERLGAAGHLLYSGSSVAVFTVDLEISLQASIFDKLWNFIMPGKLYLAGVLPHLRRHPLEAKRPVHFFLGRAGHSLFALENSPLVKPQALCDRYLTQLH